MSDETRDNQHTQNIQVLKAVSSHFFIYGFHIYKINLLDLI